MITIKNIKWLINLADTKPLLFSIAILLGACSILALAVQNRQRKVDELEFEKRLLISTYEKKIDSIAKAGAARELKLNQEVKQTLQVIIDGYREQLKEQKEINEKVNKAIITNRKVIKNQSEYEK